jgi:RNA polymerase sigma factor (sigma-70 family)
MVQTDDDLIRDLYPGLRRFASVVAPPDEDPNDLVQSVLCRVLRSRSLTELEHPGAYLRRAILNEATTRRRSFARRWRALARLGPPDSPPTTYEWDVEELLQLPPKERAVLYLNVIEGRPFDEISEMIGGSAASLRMTATRARRRLRGLLDGEVDDASA